MTTGGGGGAEEEESPAPARRPSRYESQKRRDWQTFTRYLGAHRPPLQLRRCSGAHVLEFLRYLDRFGKTRVHAPPCPAYGGRLASSSAPAPPPAHAAAEAASCQCPLRQAWGSLDALVGRLRAAFDERHGPRGSGTAETATAPPDNNAAGSNPFAARAVRLYLRDVRDAQARARGISYTRKKKKRSKPPQQGKGTSTTTCAAAKHDAAGCARAHGMNNATMAASMSMAPAVPQPSHPHPIPLLPPPPAYLTGVPFECCDHGGSVFGGPNTANGGAAGFYLPLLFNTFG
ncbi:unnamed protein product [Urochloa decumbens]|uniref:ALOG domain-containing protein n=1 Tax=Urochloa decumbens TaxID=240449 RepID=A0ABC9GBI5_9POAL